MPIIEYLSADVRRGLFDKRKASFLRACRANTLGRDNNLIKLFHRPICIVHGSKLIRHGARDIFFFPNLSRERCSTLHSGTERKFVFNRASSLVISLWPLLHTHQCYLNFLLHIPVHSHPYRSFVPFISFILCIGVSRKTRVSGLLYRWLQLASRCTRRRPYGIRNFPCDLRSCDCWPTDNQKIHFDLFHAGRC